MSLFFNPRPTRAARRTSTSQSLAAMLKRRSHPLLATLTTSPRATGTPLRSIPRRRKLRTPAYRAATPGPRMFRVG